MEKQKFEAGQEVWVRGTFYDHIEGDAVVKIPERLRDVLVRCYVGSVLAAPPAGLSGLRELVARWRDSHIKYHDTEAMVMVRCADQLEVALASTAEGAPLTATQIEDIHRIIERHSTDVVDYESAADDVSAYLFGGIEQPESAHREQAIPSPQDAAKIAAGKAGDAPQCCCNASWLDLDQRDCLIHGPKAQRQTQPVAAEPEASVWKRAVKFCEEHLAKPDDDGCSCELHRLLTAYAETRVLTQVLEEAEWWAASRGNHNLGLSELESERIATLRQSAK